jgi:uncharacterized protein YgiM (DUF1202 family)
VFSALLSACAPGQPSESALQTGVAQTLQIAMLETAAAGGQQQATAQASDTAGPTQEPSATFTATVGIATTTVSQNTNCRSGPSQFYALVTTVQANQVVEVLKIYNGANYVVIRNPNGAGDCWLWLQYASNTNFASFNLPLATQPPTPFPTNTATATTPPWDWNGTWNTYIAPAMTLRVVTLSKSGNSVTGGYVYPGGSVYITGTLSDEGQTLTGTWDDDSNGAGVDGNFVWQIKPKNTNQFVGNWGGGGWCGARSGASTPDPCEGP